MYQISYLWLSKNQANTLKTDKIQSYTTNYLRFFQSSSNHLSDSKLKQLTSSFYGMVDKDGRIPKADSLLQNNVSLINEHKHQLGQTPYKSTLPTWVCGAVYSAPSEIEKKVESTFKRRAVATRHGRPRRPITVQTSGLGVRASNRTSATCIGFFAREGQKAGPRHLTMLLLWHGATWPRLETWWCGCGCGRVCVWSFSCVLRFKYTPHVRGPPHHQLYHVCVGYTLHVFNIFMLYTTSTIVIVIIIITSSENFPFTMLSCYAPGFFNSGEDAAEAAVC